MKNFFSKCAPFRRKLWTWSHLRKKSLTRNFIFCVVLTLQVIQNMIDIKEDFVQWFAKIFDNKFSGKGTKSENIDPKTRPQTTDSKARLWVSDLSTALWTTDLPEDPGEILLNSPTKQNLLLVLWIYEIIKGQL